MKNIQEINLKYYKEEKQMKFGKYIDMFVDYLKAINFSERTIESYSAYAKQFLSFVENYYTRIKSLERITKQIILDYQSYLANYKDKRGSSLSNRTQSFKLKAVKKFFHFLIKKDIILKDPSTVITFPKEDQRFIRNVLSQKEVFELLDNIKLNTPVNIRNRAILELFYACGIRTSELCDLKAHDIDLKEQTVTILKGKGNKSRILPIGQYASYYIQLYLEKSRKFMLKGKRNDPGNLFLSKRGNPFDKSTINKTVIKSVLRNINIKKHVSCYTMRHSIATHLLSNNVSIMHIAKLLGHSSLKTTQNYLKIEISDLKKMHSLYHPRETQAKS
jgi:site-specific recombinase XerD